MAMLGAPSDPLGQALGALRLTLSADDLTMIEQAVPTGAAADLGLPNPSAPITQTLPVTKTTP